LSSTQSCNSLPDIPCRESFDQHLKLSPLEFGIEFVFPTCENLTFRIEMQFLLSLEALKTNSSGKHPREFGDWDDFISIKLITEMESNIMSSSLLANFKHQVDTNLLELRNEKSSGNESLNWFGIFEKSAVSLLPFMIFSRQLQACITDRNAKFLISLTPTSNIKARREAERQCEHVEWVRTRFSSASKVHYLLKVNRKLKSTLSVEEVRSLASQGRIIPKTEVQHFDMDVCFDAVDSPSQQVISRGVRGRHNAMIVEHASVDNFLKEENACSFLNKILLSFFQ